MEGGHFLDEDISVFDAPFFNMTSDEAAVSTYPNAAELN